MYHNHITLKFCLYSIFLHTGAGIYVLYSRYISSSAVANNTIAVRTNGPCSHCDMYFYCHSEATRGTAYIRFPNNARIYSNSRYADMRVYQENPSGVRAYNYPRWTPDYFGVYTCEAPDSRGNILHFSIVWYSSTPGTHLTYCVSLVEKNTHSQ